MMVTEMERQGQVGRLNNNLREVAETSARFALGGVIGIGKSLTTS